MSALQSWLISERHPHSSGARLLWKPAGQRFLDQMARTAIWHRHASKVSTLMNSNDLKLSRVSSKDTLGVLAKVFLTEFLALALVAFITIGSPSFAQSQSSPMPANAQPKSYGDGWECDRGYRRDGDACLAVIVPQNAYATNRTYGRSWECLYGFQEVDDATCLEVVVPKGGYLDTSGQRWNCLRGYMKVDDICLEVVVPNNAYLSTDAYGAAWLCNRGYQVEGDTCVAITVPENAYLDDASYGTGWKCNRGFAESNGGCTEIDLPDNANLNRSGNWWECHSNFRRFKGRCVLND
jgi:hypothetical protein